MPQVSAADLRSAPSSTIARASIRRAAEPSFSRPAAARSSAAVKSTRVIATAPPIDVCSSLMSKHRVRVSSIWESQNESKAAAVGIRPLRLGRLLLCGLLSFDRQKQFLLACGGLAGLLAFSGGRFRFQALFQRIHQVDNVPAARSGFRPDSLTLTLRINEFG